MVSLFGDINFQESMIQTNASSGRGGTIGFNANQNIIINDANLYARGSPDSQFPRQTPSLILKRREILTSWS